MTQDMVKMMSQDKMIGKWEILSSSPSPWFSRFLRTMLLLLMMTLAVGEMWGQDTDYSGKYYIASDAIVSSKSTYDANTPANNYYLCPTEGWCYYKPDNNYDADGTTYPNPFLTTFKWRDGVNDNKVIWIIEKCTNSNYSNYYYIKQHIAGNRYKYLMLNGKISGTPNNNNAKNRMRVHLEEHVEDTDNPTTNALFSITLVTSTHASSLANEKSVIITPKNTESEDSKCKYLVVNGGNTNATTGQEGKGDGPGSTNEEYKWTKGIIGLYYDDNAGNVDISAPFYLENKPTISYSDQSLIRITYFDYAENEVEIRYTTNGDTPTANSTLYEGEFDPEGDVTTIKAIAIKDGKVSDVTTFTPPVFLGSMHKYLIQSQGNGWATGNFQGCHYYVIPGDVEGNVTKVNTTTMLRPSMQWYFLDAGDNYYYIVNNVDNTRMRYNTTDGVHMDTWDDGNADEFKFQIVESATAGTYNIIPYGVTAENKYLDKSGGNAGDAGLLLYKDATQPNSRWKFVPQSTPLADTPPFTPSGASTSVYYKIQNGNGTTFHITPPSSVDGNATASNATDDASVKSMSWFFIQVEDPTVEDWLAYYKIINAGTGKAMYYAYTADNKPCLKVGDYDGNNDNYKFAFVKSPTADYYYIVPKSHKDDQLNNISTFSRSNSSIIPATTRAASGYVWTFIPADLFCNDPEFVEEEGVIKIRCNTNGAKIYINTESDDNPTIADENLYAPTTNENQNWATTDQVRIKAIAVVSDGTNSVSSSVFTLLNNPDITLGGTAPYIYNASPWEPGVTEVSIGEAPNKTSSTSGYSIAYSENHTDAGEVTVTVTDNVEDDLFIKNASTTFTIQRKDVTITASNASKPYDGEPLMKSGFTAGDLETGDTHTFTVAMTAESTITDAGTQPNEIATVDGVSVTTGTETVVGNYLVTTANGTLTVNPASVTLTANSRNTDVYDGTEKTVTGFTCKLGEQTVDGLNFEGVSASGSGTNAGDYDVTFTGVTVNETKDNTGNYVVIGTTVGTLTIKPASVTLIANSRNTDVYDGTEKTVTGFICKMGEQTVEGLTFAESVAASGSGTNAGEYDVTFTGVTLNETKDNTGNYIVTGTTDGTLTITAKEITIGGITAENKDYDGTTDAVLVYTGVTFTGKLDGETLTVTATGAFIDKNVGTGKTVNITGLTLGGTGAANYALAESGQQETATADITPALVTVTAEDKTKGYGDADPELTWTVDGLKGTDTKDVLTVSMSRTEGEDVGTTITITPSGDTEQGNYTVSYVTGTLTITAKAIGDGTTPAEGIDIDISYDGTDYTVTVKQGENELQQGEDKAYTWTGADGSTDTYVVTITGQGNYNNSAKATYIKQTFYDTTPDQVLTTETTAAVYCATQNLKVNDTFEAYYVTKLENNSLTITKVEAGEGENKKNYIPEGQPVLLISETNPAPKGFTLKPYTGTDLVTIPTTGEGANLLKVVPDEGGRAVNLEEVYIFAMGEFVLNKAGTMSKGKFYLENPDYNTSAHSRSILSITSGDVTGIHTSQLSDTDSQIPDIWYTIGGQKLHKKPTRKGIYLHNGKKVVIK